MYAWKSIYLNMIYHDDVPGSKAGSMQVQVPKKLPGGMKSLQPEDQPYEKCLAAGPSSLTDSQLLAVIIRTGTRGLNAEQLAQKILSLSQNHCGITSICHLSLQELMKLPGIGKVKAIQLLCIGELSKRIATTHAKKRMVFEHPDTIAEYYMEQLRHKEQECLICMMLDTKNQLIGEELISKGTVNASMISPREIFLLALQYHAVHIILVHNHPSGDPTPSREDVLITEQIKQAGYLVNIHLLDHIIIGDRSYCSFKELDLMDEENTV